MRAVFPVLGLLVAVPTGADVLSGVEFVASLVDVNAAMWAAVSALSAINPNLPPNGRYLGLLVERRVCRRCDQVFSTSVGSERLDSCRACRGETFIAAWRGRVLRRWRTLVARRSNPGD